MRNLEGYIKTSFIENDNFSICKIYLLTYEWSLNSETILYSLYFKRKAMDDSIIFPIFPNSFI